MNPDRATSFSQKVSVFIQTTGVYISLHKRLAKDWKVAAISWWVRNCLPNAKTIFWEQWQTASQTSNFQTSKFLPTNQKHFFLADVKSRKYEKKVIITQSQENKGCEWLKLQHEEGKRVRKGTARAGRNRVQISKRKKHLLNELSNTFFAKHEMCDRWPVATTGRKNQDRLKVKAAETKITLHLRYFEKACDHVQC